MAITCGDIPRLICSVIIPPVGVFFQVGCTKDLAINCQLTLLGYDTDCLVACFSSLSLSGRVAHLIGCFVCCPTSYIPGVIHAVYILIKE